MASMPPITMQCMEVWGGNRAASNGVVMPGLDAWVVSRPLPGHDEGGDIHYLSSCATGSITRMLVADVSGHGSIVGDVAMKLRGMMRRHVNFVDQSRVMEIINREFSGIAQAGGFATALVATYWAPRRTLVISNAGHPRPLIYRASARRWEPLAFSVERAGLTNIPLGIAEPTTYDQVRFTLSSGDLVLVYTDSLIDAKVGARERLGERGVLEELGTLDAGRPEDLAEALVDRVTSRTASGELDDDATVLVARPNALAARASVTVKLRGAFDVARRLLGR